MHTYQFHQINSNPLAIHQLLTIKILFSSSNHFSPIRISPELTETPIVPNWLALPGDNSSLLGGS